MSLMSEMNHGKIKPPSEFEVIQFFRENGYKDSAAKTAWAYYEKIRTSNNGRVWRDTNERVIKNWKLKMRQVWFRPENKLQDEIQRGF